MRTREAEISLQAQEAALYQQGLIVGYMRGDSRFTREQLEEALATYRQVEAECRRQWATWLKDRKVTA